MGQLSKKEKEKSGRRIIGLSLTVISLMILLQIILTKDMRYDPSTFCPEEYSYPHTILLFDKTDPLTQSQRFFVRKLIHKLKKDLKRHEKLSIYVLDNMNYIGPQSEFAMCNPGTGDDASELYQNPQMIQRKFDEFFGKPLNKTLERLVEAQVSQQSPILEMFREISFIEDFGPITPSRRLIIVSDMMHNMPAYSHYRHPIDYHTFSTTPYASEVKALLGGVKVEITYLWRPELRRFQTAQHIGFWEQYFLDAGAQLMNVRRVR